MLKELADALAVRENNFFSILTHLEKKQEKARSNKPTNKTSFVYQQNQAHESVVNCEYSVTNY